MVMPRQKSVLSRYVERRPIFHHYRIEEQLDALYSPVVTLPSGGSVVIDQTEALVAIDVNSGKQKLGGHEETALQTNIEAAAEVARQLRLRDLGGIVVIDFIDMALRKNQAKVEKVMRAALKSDKARIKVGRISRNGTLELTRQRLRSSLAASVFRSCSVCKGTGRILKPAFHATAVLRKLVDRASRGDLASAVIRIEPEAANLLRTERWAAVQEIEQRFGVRVEIQIERSFLPGQDDFTFETDPDAVPVEPEEPNFGPAYIPEEVQAELAAMEAEEKAELELEEDEDDDALDADEVAAAARANRNRKRNRGGNRRKGGADKNFEMPSFELIDPAELGLKSGGSGGRRKEGEEEGSRRRGRRGGRRRRGRNVAANADRSPNQRSGARRNERSAKEKSTPKAAPPPPKKKGFFARLFSWNRP